MTPKSKLFISILAFMLIVNILVIFNLNYFYIRAILAFVFLIIVPGLLIMLCLKIRNINPWEYLVYTVGLSVAFIMFAGLAVNWILPWLNITDKPLSLYPILICFDTILLVLWLIAHKRNEDNAHILIFPFEEYEIKGKKRFKFIPKFPSLSWLDRIFIIIPFCFPFMAVIGAFLLNNHGTNIVTMIMLGAIVIYVFMIVIFREKLNENVFLWVLYWMGLALLLMYSMRSWYISGPDISLEYQIFLLTKENFHWSILNISNAYNACLSITILPTIFSWFLEINDQYIFKLLFPLIFSFVPVTIYLFLKRYSKNILAFLAVFFFISYPSFLFNIPTHMKGTISLLFFSLMLLVLFSKEINPKIKNLLFVIFGFSMIVSHYSTSYIALAIFLLVYIFTLIYKIYEDKKIKRGKLKPSEKQELYLTGGIIILLLVLGFLWYSQLTPTADGLIDFTKKSFSNLGNIFNEDVRAEQASPLDQFNIFYKPKDQTISLKDYKEEIESRYENKSYINPYTLEKYEDYKPKVIYPSTIPIRTNLDIISKIYFLLEVIKKLVKIFMIIGVFYLLFFQLKKKKLDPEYIIMALVGLFLLIAIICLPFATINYDLERAYQQILIMLSLPAVFGGLIAFKFLRRDNIKIILIGFIFILYFLSGSGFIQQTLGGNPPFLQLNNLGLDYDRFYTHETEIKSITWLSEDYNKKYLIYADRDNMKKILIFSDSISSVIESVFPSIIDKNAYVSVSYTNDINKRAFIYVKGRSLGYNFPNFFLDNNKNLIYNNGGSEIFK